MPSARKRSNKNFVAIPFAGTLALSTLGQGAVLTAGLTGTLTEDLYAISADVQAEITGLTAGEGNPSHCLISHGDYSDAEVGEQQDVVLLGPGNKIEQERARRLVRRVGIFSPESEAATFLNLIGKGGSRLLRTKLKFVVNSGKNLDIGVLNRSSAALTTGASLRFSGILYGRWII